MRDNCKPSCIDLIITDQPNLVLDSGVRGSLDPSVKHQIVFRKINFNLPPPPKYKRKIWHFNRASSDMIEKAISSFPWADNFQNLVPTEQVDLLNRTILNIMANFVPNEIRTIRPREPEWMNKNIKRLLRNQSKVFKRYKRNGYKNDDKQILENLKIECQNEIMIAKDKYSKNLGAKLANSHTGQKSYWKIMNKFPNKCKIPKIPPLFFRDKFITNCREKANLFNEYFSSQCTPFENDSELPELTYLTNSRFGTSNIIVTEINDMIIGLNVNKAYGPDQISANMLKLCGRNLCIPLKMIFNNIIITGNFPDQ